jgi:inner membrane protein
VTAGARFRRVRVPLPVLVASYLGSHALFIGVALATHALLGYTLGRIAFGRPGAGLLAGVAPDVDLLVPAAWGPPLAHRGVTHSALALGVAVAIALAATDHSTAGAVAIAYLSHLLVDATTPMGVPLASPLATEYVGIALGGHSVAGTVLLWVAAGSLLVQGENAPTVSDTLPIRLAFDDWRDRIGARTEKENE